MGIVCIIQQARSNQRLAKEPLIEMKIQWKLHSYVASIDRFEVPFPAVLNHVFTTTTAQLTLFKLKHHPSAVEPHNETFFGRRMLLFIQPSQHSPKDSTPLFTVTTMLPTRSSDYSNNSNAGPTYVGRDITGGTNASANIPAPSIPADYADPNHPHMGEIERQPVTTAPKTFPWKRVALGLILGLSFLGALAASTGTAVWYGKTHTKKPAPLAGVATTATATAVLTSKVQTRSKSMTETTIPFNLPTYTTIRPGLPTSNACMIGGLFPARGECERDCKGLKGRGEARCDSFFDDWMCLQCVPPPEGDCRIGTTYGSLSDCTAQCLSTVYVDTGHCVSAADGFWNCFKCPVKKQETVPFETPIRAEGANKASKTNFELPVVTTMSKEAVAPSRVTD
jgi:hypothetical protein